MDPHFKTSFIPQKIRKPHAEAAKMTRISILSAAVYGIFVITLAASVGIFLYKQFLTNKTETLRQTFEDAKEAFEPKTIETLKRVDKKMRLSEKVLDNHILETPLFEILKKITLQTVRYTNFNFTAAPGGGGTLSMSGEALDFSSIALQADIFSENTNFKSSVFSNLNKTTEGMATFDFVTEVAPELLKYK